MMWFLPLLHILAHFGPVSSDSKQGEIILRSKNNACEGYVEAYYGGEKGYIGDKHWSRETEEVVCRSTHCGRPMVGTENVYRPLKSKVWLNELNCNGKEQSLWECGGWPGPEISFYKKPTVKKIKCSNKISFHLKQHKCEGAVQYTIQSNDKENEDGYICSDGFGSDEARVLCKSLGCGGFVEMIKSEWMRDDEFNDAKKVMIKCGNIKDVDHLWQCVKSKPSQCDLPASVRCEGHTRVQLIGETSNVCSGKLKPVDGNLTEIHKTDSDWCKKLHCGSSEAGKQNNSGHHLRCTDTVQVVLTDGPNSETKCYGEVKIKVNHEHKSVCADGWNDKASEMVCKELKCGEVIKFDTKKYSTTGIINYVTCKGHESSLWYCRAEHRQQSCTSAPYVVCSESLELRLEDGPGRCAGRLEVKVEGRWKRVSKDGWKDSYTKLACNQLKCGDNGKVKSGEFSEGNEDFLKFTCEDDAKKLSNCMREPKETKDGKPVELVCNENKVLFLEGDESCSGLVGIEHGEKPYWLSGSEEMWNKSLADKVCQQMHCVEALSISRFPSEDKLIWNWSLSCSPDQKSIFDCNKTEIHPSDHNQTIAYVKCKGNIVMNLTNNCWGTVIISTSTTEGAVSELHWSENLSKKLCEEKGCGTGVLKPLRNSHKSHPIIFKSLHATKHSTNISQYSIVKMEERVPTQNLNPAYVVCKGSLKSRFHSFRHKCSGNVEVFYDGEWLPVRKDALNDENTQNTICKELNCGQALEKNTYFGPRPTASDIVSVSGCSSSEIAKCKDITLEKNSKTELGSLQCSNWRTVALEVENACKGEVVVYSDGGPEPKRSFISSQGWTKAEGEKLCVAMNCRSFLSMNISTKPPEANDWWEGTFNCTSTSTDIWDCENKIQANTIQKTKLFIECEGEPVVKLSQKCSGDLTINNLPVCSSQWKTDYSHRVCQQLGCGNAILENNKRKPLNRDALHVHCDEHNYLISQCKRVNGRCDAAPVSISCSGSVSFDMSETCGGALKIKKYKKEPEDVCHFNISNDLKNKLCQDLNCGPFKEILQGKTQKINGKTSLICSDSYKDPRYCVKEEESCPNSRVDVLTCQAYVQPTKPPPDPEPTNPVPIIVGVLIILILVALIVIFVRYRIKRRNRNAMMPPHMEEADWDSGEYEDVNKSDETGSFNRGRFRSESDFQGERDVESNRSCNYDDIDEVTEAQPLTPQGSMVRAAKDEDTQEGVINRNGVTYEVDDLQENYDDIDASPEKEETTAEVHDGPKPALEDDAGAL